MPDACKVAGCSVCVVKDERLKEDTVLYRYPFSNVNLDSRICLGNNALPVYYAAAADRGASGAGTEG